MSAASKKIRAAVVLRAGGHCESCGVWCGVDGHWDHFFGRAKVKESVPSTWLLCPRCDLHKTENKPNGSHWLRRFVVHASHFGYAREVEMAETKLSTLAAKGRAA